VKGSAIRVQAADEREAGGREHQNRGCRHEDLAEPAPGNNRRRIFDDGRARNLKNRDITANRERDSEFSGMIGFGVIVFEALANFGGGGPNDRVRTGVILRGAAKDRDAEDALLQIVGFAGNGFLHDVAKKRGVAPAMLESLAGEDSFQLGQNCGSFRGAHGGVPNSIVARSVRVSDRSECRSIGLKGRDWC